MCVYMYVCMYIYIYIYVYKYVCVCVCVCVRGGVPVCVCVCVCVYHPVGGPERTYLAAPQASLHPPTSTLYRTPGIPAP
jgi:hypothetical protein